MIALGLVKALCFVWVGLKGLYRCFGKKEESCLGMCWYAQELRLIRRGAWRPRQRVRPQTLQTMVSGTRLIWGLGTRMSDPYVYVAFWAPRETFCWKFLVPLPSSLSEVPGSTVIWRLWSSFFLAQVLQFLGAQEHGTRDP